MSPIPLWLGETIRRRFGPEEQAIFGMLLAGIQPTDIADTLGVSDAGLESRLWTMLRTLEAPDHERKFNGPIGDAA